MNYSWAIDQLKGTVMGNNFKKKRGDARAFDALAASRKIIATIASFAIAFSLFAMPTTAAFASNSTPDDEWLGLTNHPASDSGNTDAAGINMSELSKSDDEVVDDDVITEEVVANEDSDDEQSNEEPSILDAIFNFFGSISPFSVSAQEETGAKVTVRLNSHIPATTYRNFDKCEVKIERTDGGSPSSLKQNFVETNPSIYTATISNVPPGTYRLSVTGEYFRPYVHKNTFTIKSGELAELSLIDVLYEPNILNTTSWLGLFAYGDFNGDQVIDKSDSEIITKALAEKSTDNKFNFHDNNGAETMDILDVQLYSTNLGVADCSAQTIRITQNVSLMDFSLDNNDPSANFMPTTAYIDELTPGDAGYLTDEAALERLAFNDGNSVVLTNPINLANTGATSKLSEDPVGFIVDPQGASASKIVLQAAMDSSGNPKAMPTSGTITVQIVNDQPETTPVISFYKNFSTISSQAYSIRPMMTEDEFAQNDYEFQRNTTVTVDQSTGAIVLQFPKAVKLSKLIFDFNGTSDPDGKCVKLSQLQLFGDASTGAQAASLDDNVIANDSSSEATNAEESADEPAPIDTLIENAQVPAIESLSATDGEIHAMWQRVDDAVNYEMELTNIDADTQASKTTYGASNVIVSSVGDVAVENDATYKLRVRSITPLGVSSWSEPAEATCINTAPPAAVENINFDPGYGQIKLSWNGAENANSYIVYYRQASKAYYGGDWESLEVENPEVTIGGLEALTAYEFYVVSVNEFAQGEPSPIMQSETVAVGAKLPWYNLINRTVQDPNGYNAGDIIKAVSVDGNTTADAWKAVDGDFNSYVSLKHESKIALASGLDVSFNDPQSIRYIALTTSLAEGAADGISQMSVSANIGDGKDARTETFTTTSGLLVKKVPATGTLLEAEDALNSVYLALPYDLNDVTAIHVNFKREIDGNTYPATISEFAIYAPDGLADEINTLWTNSHRKELADDVDNGKLDALAKKVCQVDATSGEMHPLVKEFAKDIDIARQMLIEKNSTTIDVDTSITQQDVMGAKSAWQPMGASAKAGETYTVNVSSSSSVENGSSVPLQMIITQHNALYGEDTIATYPLKLGVNEITTYGSDPERGGSIYVEYLGDSEDQTYTVTIIGATQIPVLKLDGIDDEIERKAAIATYINELSTYVNNMDKAHSAAHHIGTGFFGMFDGATCTANETQVVTDHAMLSLSATDVYLNFTNGLDSTDEQASRASDALRKLDDSIALICEQVGYVSHDYPKYQREEYGVSLLSNAKLVFNEFDINSASNAASIAGDRNAFANEGSVAINADTVRNICAAEQDAELAIAMSDILSASAFANDDAASTYYAMLVADNSSIDYASIIDYTSSRVYGSIPASIAPALYWQLHEVYDTQSKALPVMTKINTLATSPENVYGLEIEDADAGCALARLACAATSRDLTEFFKAWGIALDEDTIEFASRYKTEDRLIQYLTDDKASKLASGKAQCSFDPEIEILSFDCSIDNGSAYLTNLSGAEDAIALEVYRKAASEDEFQLVGYVERDAFANDNFFTENISDLTSGNVQYAVRGIDETLTPSAFTYGENIYMSQAAGKFVNVADKSGWKIESTLSNATDDSVYKAIDGDHGSVYFGAYDADADNASDVRGITFAFDKATDVCGIVYRPGLKDRSFRGLRIEISDDGKNWQTVDESRLYVPAQGEFSGFDAYGSSDRVEIYFGDVRNPFEDATKQTSANSDNASRAAIAEAVSGKLNVSSSDSSSLQIYTTNFIRLTEMYNNVDEIDIAEFDVISKPLDQAEIFTETNQYGIGKITHDLSLNAVSGDSNEIVIPKGSFVICGKYQGDPRYNTIVLRDSDGNIIADPQKQVIITNKSNDGDIAIISQKALVYEGIWLYYFEPGTYEDMIYDISSITPEIYRSDYRGSLENAKLISIGQTSQICRQGINDDLENDLFAINLEVGLHEAYN